MAQPAVGRLVFGAHYATFVIVMRTWSLMYTLPRKACWGIYLCMVVLGAICIAIHTVLGVSQDSTTPYYWRSPDELLSIRRISRNTIITIRAGERVGLMFLVGAKNVSIVWELPCNAQSGKEKRWNWYGFRFEQDYVNLIVFPEDSSDGEIRSRYWYVMGDSRVQGTRAIPSNSIRQCILVPLWFAAALYLFLLSPILFWFVRRYFRLRRGHCVRCAYDLHRNLSGVCPECGAPIKSAF